VVRPRTLIIGLALAALAGAPALAAPGHAGHPAPAAADPVRTGPPVVYRAAGPPRVRKAVTDLTASERARLVRAILITKRTPSPWDRRFSVYDNFVWWHRQAFACSVDQAHMRPAFLPWHRQFLFMFESALRRYSGDATVTLPFWDWTDPRAIGAVFRRDLMGPNGDPAQGFAVTEGPFRKGRWRLTVLDPRVQDRNQITHLTRRFGSMRFGGTLPTRASVLAALRLPDYDVPPYSSASDPSLSFRNNLEGWRGMLGGTCRAGWMDPVAGRGRPRRALHNLVHTWVGGELPPLADDIGGTMTLNTSLNDPVFWLHHANIDRLWAIWQRRHPGAAGYAPVRAGGLPYGQNLAEPMWPWRQAGLYVAPVSVLSTRAMGYVYAPAPAARGGILRRPAAPAVTG
jgi:tyrosinase